MHIISKILEEQEVTKKLLPEYLNAGDNFFQTCFNHIWKSKMFGTFDMDNRQSFLFEIIKHILIV